MSYAYENIHLSIMAIESAATRLNISSSEMYRRLNAQGLVHSVFFCPVPK